MSPRSPRSLGRAAFGGLVIAWLALLVGVPFISARGDDHAYGDLGDAGTLFVVLTIPVVLALVLVAVAVSVLGWWRDVAIEQLGAPRWARWCGATIVGAAVVAIDWSQLADLGAGFAVLALATCLALAAGAELLFRGVAVCRLRRAGCGEDAVARRSSAISAIALAGWFLVESPFGVAELAVLAILGYPFYVLRRAAGTIVAPIAVHGVVLFGLSSGGWVAAGPRYLGTIISLVVLLAVAVTTIVLHARLDGPVEAVESVAPVDRRPLGAALRWAGGTLAVVVVVAVVAMLVPVSSGNLEAHPEPASSFEEAVERFTAATADEAEIGVFEPCRSILLDHGETTEVSVVLFHGLTNCPEQFRELGQQLHDDGANVLILRAPHHGLADSTGQAIGGVDLVGDLTAQELRDYADTSIDIAAGLGDQVRVLGLSMGGVVSMWTAQFREVDRVVAVAPAVSIPGVPHLVTTGYVNLFNRLPNFSLPTSGIELDHTYDGESTGALAAMFLLARANENELTRQRSAADEVVVVLNPDDDQVDFDHVRELVAGWDDGDGPVEVVELPAIGLPHDVIDPAQPAGDVDLVYPILLDLLQR